jgi:hypothetical protein
VKCHLFDNKDVHLIRLCRMDPINNSLLRTFECSIFDLNRLASSNWEPPVKLTTHERDIVERAGSVLLQGRGNSPPNLQLIFPHQSTRLSGGTGKTLCLISRFAAFARMCYTATFEGVRVFRKGQSTRNRHKILKCDV